MKNLFFLFFFTGLTHLSQSQDTLVQLSAHYDKQIKAVQLKWLQNGPAGTVYTLQKSSDQKNWTGIFSFSVAGGDPYRIQSFYDYHPHPSKNHYRMQLKYPSGSILHAASILVIIGNNNSSWDLYPVPVTDVLNLQYTGSEPIRGAITVYIRNAAGKILNRTRVASVYRIVQLPVSNLGRGIYDVVIVVQDKIIWNQRFIK